MELFLSLVYCSAFSRYSAVNRCYFYNRKITFLKEKRYLPLHTVEDGGSRWSHGDELGAVVLEVRMKGQEEDSRGWGGRNVRNVVTSLLTGPVSFAS